MSLRESRFGKVLLGLPVLVLLAMSACSGQLPTAGDDPKDACIWLEDRFICP